MENNNLRRAQREKKDDFFTLLPDIEYELDHYKDAFKDKIIYCNCDDENSNFWRYFYCKFKKLKLKKLIATHYVELGSSYALISNDGQTVNKIELTDNGSFDSLECISYLKQADIVVTNPPFSQFRKFIRLLMTNNKKFIIWGNMNAISYKEFFPLIMHQKVWLGYIINKNCVFRIPDDYLKWDVKETNKHHDGYRYGTVPSITVFTNIKVDKSDAVLSFTKYFKQQDYLPYDNYAAFEVGRINDIPVDTTITAKILTANVRNWQEFYQGDLTILKQDNEYTVVKINRPVWGVPITFLAKYSLRIADDYEIMGLTGSRGWNNINKLKNYKQYVNIRHVSKFGKITWGGSMPTRAGVIDNNTKSAYYLADNVKGKFVKKYARILIRKRKNLV